MLGASIVAAVVVVWPIAYYAWQARNTESVIVRLGVFAEELDYFLLEEDLAQQFTGAVQQHSRPERFPAVASGVTVAAFHFDADGKCIHCVRILGQLLGGKGRTELVNVVQRGERLADRHAKELIGGDYSIATRRLAD